MKSIPANEIPVVLVVFLSDIVLVFAADFFLCYPTARVGSVFVRPVPVAYVPFHEEYLLSAAVEQTDGVAYIVFSFPFSHFVIFF